MPSTRPSLCCKSDTPDLEEIRVALLTWDMVDISSSWNKVGKMKNLFQGYCWYWRGRPDSPCPFAASPLKPEIIGVSRAVNDSRRSRLFCLDARDDMTNRLIGGSEGFLPAGIRDPRLQGHPGRSSDTSRRIPARGPGAPPGLPAGERRRRGAPGAVFLHRLGSICRGARERGIPLSIEDRARLRPEETRGFDKLRQISGSFKPVPMPDLPPFLGGGVGYFAYDLVRQFEKLPC